MGAQSAGSPSSPLPCSVFHVEHEIPQIRIHEHRVVSVDETRPAKAAEKNQRQLSMDIVTKEVKLRE
tara:strand:- start:220 stop:420 length:201 start_codon:yes stop_codon:yes gene_type:complete